MDDTTAQASLCSAVQVRQGEAGIVLVAVKMQCEECAVVDIVTKDRRAFVAFTEGNSIWISPAVNRAGRDHLSEVRLLTEEPVTIHPVATCEFNLLRVLVALPKGGFERIIFHGGLDARSQQEAGSADPDR